MALRVTHAIPCWECLARLTDTDAGELYQLKNRLEFVRQLLIHDEIAIQALKRDHLWCGHLGCTKVFGKVLKRHTNGLRGLRKHDAGNEQLRS